MTILTKAQFSVFMKLSKEITDFMKLSKEITDLALKCCVCQYQYFQGIAEKYIECLNMLQCHCKETLADMVMIEQLGTENFKERRIVNTYRRKSCLKIKNQIWQQAVRTLKYIKYELRIYEEKKICR